MNLSVEISLLLHSSPISSPHLPCFCGVISPDHPKHEHPVWHTGTGFLNPLTHFPTVPVLTIDSSILPVTLYVWSDTYSFTPSNKIVNAHTIIVILILLLFSPVRLASEGFPSWCNSKSIWGCIRKWILYKKICWATKCGDPNEWGRSQTKLKKHRSICCIICDHSIVYLFHSS